MGSVNLNHIDARLDRTNRSIHERLLDPLDALLRELLRLGEACRVGDRAWGDDVVGPAIEVFCGSRAEREPRRDGGGFAAGVGELDGDFLVLRVDEGDDLFEGGDVLVRPDAEVLWRDAAFGGNGGRLEEGQARSTRGNATDCDE